MLTTYLIWKNPWLLVFLNVFLLLLLFHLCIKLFTYVGIKDNECVRYVPSLLVVLTTTLLCAVCRPSDLAHHCVWGLQVIQKIQFYSPVSFLKLSIVFPHSTPEISGIRSCRWEIILKRGSHKFLPVKNLNPRVSCMTSYRKKQFSA